MKISVVICTRNRSRSLARTLASIAAGDAPLAAALEVVVVDNGSSDDTRRTLASFADRLPIVVVSEPAPGQSRARNAAIRATRPDWFLWTDDDVVVDRGWLRAYEAAFARDPDAAVFGGPIRPRLDGVPPRWLVVALPLLQPAYAGLDLGPRPRPLGGSPRALPFGANFAVRGAEQRAVRYDPALGRLPGRLRGGDESEVVRRILAAGGRGLWLPDAGVEHWIDAERQSVRYLRAYYADVAERAARRAHGGGAMRFGAVCVTRARITWCDMRYCGGRLAARPRSWVRALEEAARLRGRLAARRPVAASVRS